MLYKNFGWKMRFGFQQMDIQKYTTLISLIPTNQSFGHPHESIISRRRGRKMFALKSYWPGLFKQSAQWIYDIYSATFIHINHPHPSSRQKIFSFGIKITLDLILITIKSQLFFFSSQWKPFFHWHTYVDEAGKKWAWNIFN